MALVHLLLNVLWLVLSGIPLALGYVFAGIIAVIFIITIPFGFQSFKLAGYALWPFGRMVVRRRDADAALSLVGNVIWLIVAGWWLALAHILSGLLLFITIIGIPFGVANMKLAGLALAPFGTRIVPVGTVPTGTTIVASIPQG